MHPQTVFKNIMIILDEYHWIEKLPVLMNILITINNF